MKVSDKQIRRICKQIGAERCKEHDAAASAYQARALVYLQNNRERMQYAKYRQQGMPLTSSYVESAVTQFNYRVKGTEKFWDEEGAEEILQLRADFLSE